MKRSIIVSILVVIWASVTFGAMSFTETFDTGVGPFVAVAGHGATDFAWDPVNQNISASFYRDTILDLRYAVLDHNYNVHDTTATFSLEVTPISVVLGPAGMYSNMAFGFFNSNKEIASNNIIVAFGQQSGGNDLIASSKLYYADGTRIPSGTVLTCNYGTTYLFDGVLNGPGNLISIDLYEVGTNGNTLLGTFEIDIDPTETLIFNSFGFISAENATDTIAQFDAAVDNISLDIVPEPTTLVLLGLGGIMVRRKLRI